MTERKFEVPAWMPRVIRENRPEAGDGVGAALKFGILYTANLFGSLWNRLGGVGFVALSVGWSVLALSIGQGWQFVLADLACGIAAGRVWYAAKTGMGDGPRIGTSVLAGAVCAVFSWGALAMVSALAIPAVVIAVIVAVVRGRGDEAEQREFREAATSLKPWTVFWGHVANDDGNAEEWAKIRPCIALPTRSTWKDGRPPIDEKSAGYPKDWYADGFPALTCTSQVKRKDDPMYLEIRPFPTEYTRSFVRVEVGHIVMSPTLQGDKQIQLRLFHERRTPDTVVVEKLGPLLNLEDRRKIAEAFRPTAPVKPATAPVKLAMAPVKPAGAPTGPSSPTTGVRRDQLDPTLALLGNPHDLWMSVMPEYYAALPDQAKMDHVELIFEFARWSIEMHNAHLPWPALQGKVDRRHFELAVMTGILLRTSKPYQVAAKRYQTKEWANADAWIRYALLMAGPNPSPAGFPALIRESWAELDFGLFERHFTSTAVRECVTAFEG